MATRKLVTIITAKDLFTKTMTKAQRVAVSSATKIRKEWAQTSRILRRAGLAVGVAATAAGVALFALTKRTAMMGDSFDKMALRTGISTQALSELKHAAEISGSSIEDVEKGFKTLAKRMSDANFGLETYQRIFRKLNVEYKDADGNLRAVDDVFTDVSVAIGGLSSETEKAALAQEFFGRAGTKLLPLMKAGTGGIAELRAEARNLGLTFSELEADQSAEFIDALTRVKTAGAGLQKEFALNLIPTFTKWAEEGTAWIVKLRNEGKVAEWAETVRKNLGELKDGIEDFLPSAQKLLTWGKATVVTFGDIGAGLGIAAAKITGANLDTALESANKELARFQVMAARTGQDINSLSIFGQTYAQTLQKVTELTALESRETRDSTAAQLVKNETEKENLRIKNEQTDATNREAEAELKAANALREKTTAQEVAAEAALKAKAPEVIRGGEAPSALGGDVERMNQRLTVITRFHDRRIQALINANAKESQLKAATDEAWVQTERQREETIAQIKKDGFGTAANLMQNLFVLTGSKSKAMFKLMKAASMAQTIVSGIESAQSSYAAGAKIGGPYLGAAFAAISVVATAARLKQISQTKIGGGGSTSISAGGQANPTFQGGAPDVGGPPQRIDPRDLPSQNVEIKIFTQTGTVDPASIDQIIAGINDATTNRNVLLTSVTAEG